jgi:hypothetical protein
MNRVQFQPGLSMAEFMERYGSDDKCEAALLMVLSASASYIVVPAVLPYAIPEAIPEANPSLYFGLSLGVMFPLNILFGIPLYTFIATHFLG